MKYIICGFSGAGKSYLLTQLQSVKSLSSYEFIDLDDYILEKFIIKHSSLGNFINDVGWEKFREIEKRAINQLLKRDRVVISLGGGSLNEKLVTIFLEEPTINCFWLHTSFEICWDRIKNDNNRPLVKIGKNECHKIYLERSKFFKQFKKIEKFEEIVKNISH